MENVLIIGAGVSGLSVGLTLLARGQRVRIVEQGSAGGESSWAGGGILSPLLPWDYPKPLTALALRAMRDYRIWIETAEQASGLKSDYWVSGMVISGLSDRGRALDWCRAQTMKAEPDATDCGTLRLPAIAQVRNPRLIAVLRSAFLKLGGQLHEQCPVNTLVRQAGQISLTTPRGRFDGDQLVIATGAWAGLPLAGLSPVPHIRPIRGQMLLFKLAPGTLKTILYRQGLYVIPRLDGHILVGSTLEDCGFNKTISADSTVARQLHIQAADLLPILAKIKPIQHWAGLRPGAPDNIPVIGPHPDHDNVFINAGHYRYGLTMAPAAAELLVDLIEGKTPALDPTPYSWASAQARQWGDQL